MVFASLHYNSEERASAAQDISVKFFGERMSSPQGAYKKSRTSAGVVMHDGRIGLPSHGSRTGRLKIDRLSHHICRGAVDMIGQERATRATLLPLGTEHEMIDDQFAAAVEKVGEGLFAARPVEHIVLFDLDPRQLRRSALSLSRSRVNSFSFFRCCLRAASHSSRDTTFE